MLISVATHLLELGSFKIKKEEVKLVAPTSLDQYLLNGRPQTIMENSMTQTPSKRNEKLMKEDKDSSKCERQRALDEENKKLHQIGKLCEFQSRRFPKKKNRGQI